MIYDVVIIGAGASGLMCASKLCGRILVVDSNKSAGAKILVSGGGKCNFSNLKISAKNYVSTTPERIDELLQFWSCKDSINLISKYKIKYEERDGGKLFAEDARKVLDALLSECRKNNVEFLFGVNIQSVEKKDELFCIDIGKKVLSKKLVIATGGKSYSRLGASDFGLRLAKQFKLKLVQNQPALVGLKYPMELRFLSNLSGVSLPVKIGVKNKVVEGNLLFAHYGITGPAVLNSSLYVDVGDVLNINFVPYKTLKTVPARALKTFMDYYEISQKDRVFDKLKNFSYKYITSFGYEKAEVMRGGVSLLNLNQNLEAEKVLGLYFIGEVLDITGEVGGFNLHIAFAMANCVARAINNP